MDIVEFGFLIIWKYNYKFVKRINRESGFIYVDLFVNLNSKGSIFLLLRVIELKNIIIF